MPTKTIYKICNTENINHLNGSITIFDFDGTTGVAIVYVSEMRKGHKNPVWHVSSEFIKKKKKKNTKWKAKHIRHNGDKQIWTFDIASKKTKHKHDNGKKYNNYLSYIFKTGELQPEEGDGTGTGGNNT